MGKQYVSKGYTLLETLVVLLVLSICSLVSLNIVFETNETNYIDEIVMFQFNSIMKNKGRLYENDDVEIYFSHLGFVSKAQTFEFDDEDYVVSFGTGRIYKR